VRGDADVTVGLLVSQPPDDVDISFSRGAQHDPNLAPSRRALFFKRFDV
jgi:hypothetical protein